MLFSKEPKLEKHRFSTSEFLEKLSAYLSQKKDANSKLIRQEIKSGNTPYIFKVRADICDRLQESLREARIPCILLESYKGDMYFLIRQKDVKKSMKVAEKTRELASFYCARLSLEELKSAYQGTNEEDKDLLNIANLKKEEAFYLASLCDENYPDAAIALNEMTDGSYSVTMHAKSGFSLNKQNQVIPLLVAKSVAAFFSPKTADRLAEDLERESLYQEAYAKSFPGKEGSFRNPTWIVGKEQKYVCRHAKGAVIGHPEEENGEITLVEDRSVKITEIDYAAKFHTMLRNITGHTCLYEEEEVKSYFKQEKKNRKNQALRKQNYVLEEEGKLIFRKLLENGSLYAKGNWKKKFLSYQKELSLLAWGIQNRKVPTGYHKEDMIHLIRLSNLLQVSLGEDFIRQMQKKEISQITLEPERIRDVNTMLKETERQVQREVPVRGREDRGRNEADYR